MYDEQLSYDVVGNVTKTNTTLPAGTDNQAFCYDEQNRLTWSGSTGTPTCSTAITTGTLPTYQQSYGYDVLDRLTQGPAGSGYTYGDSVHLNAVTSANGYTAAYDSTGNMTCRAKNGSGQSCTPTAQHGQLLTYDPLGRMLTWQSSSSSSPSTESDAYDGEGNRVQRVTTPGGSTTPTTTTFVSKDEEISVTSGTTTTIKYYGAGPVQVESINGSFSYLIQDHLGSMAIEMGSTGNLRGQQLFTPYGTQRYISGFFNSNNGFTDQYTDTNNGLSYYGARYYDPVIGQFISGDTVQGPNRYGYVSGNPETLTDPTGHNSGNGQGDSWGGVWDYFMGFNQMDQNWNTMASDFSKGNIVGGFGAIFDNIGIATTDVMMLEPLVDIADAGLKISKGNGWVSPFEADGIAAETTDNTGITNPIGGSKGPSWTPEMPQEYNPATMGSGSSDGNSGNTGGGSGSGSGNNGSSPGDNLPDFQGGKTSGVLVHNGQETPLLSGKDGPSSQMPPDAPGMRASMAVRTHVEAHAAAIMRLGGVQDATLYENHQICEGDYSCDTNLPHMLPEGSTLTVYYKDAPKGITDWVMRIYTGLPDSDWNWTRK